MLPDLLNSSRILCVLFWRIRRHVFRLCAPLSANEKLVLWYFTRCLVSMIISAVSLVLHFCRAVLDLFFRHVLRVYQWLYPLTLDCQVECYGQGNIHHDIVRKLNVAEKPGAPLVLFVYKVSRETEDLRNALQWIEGNRRRKREEICAVILLEKSRNKQNKPVEVAHQGIFDANCLVVRILWEQPGNSPARTQKNLSNQEAMDKVKQRIMDWQRSPAGGDP